MGKGNFTKEQRANAQAVLDYFIAHPERHDQREWWRFGGLVEPVKEVEKVPENLCKTTMCVAGTVMFQHYGPFGLGLFSDAEDAAVKEAGRLLGLDYDSAYALFYNTNNSEAVGILHRIVANKKNIFKGFEVY